MTLRTLLIKRL